MRLLARQSNFEMGMFDWLTDNPFTNYPWVFTGAVN